MHTFHINVLIQFLASSKCTCFEPHGFIIRKTVCICRFVRYAFHAIMYTAQLLT
jgi:hypothetical protein